MLYGISAGGVNAPQPPGTVNITAGHPPTVGLEDPTGTPPTNPPQPESLATTDAPALLPPMLESPRANRPSD